MKFRRFLSFVLGLLLIAFVVLNLLSTKFAVTEYHDSLPEIANTIIFYAFVAFKVLAALLIGIGGKKTLKASVAFVLLVGIELLFTEVGFFKDVLNAFTNNPLTDFFAVVGVEGFAKLGALALILVFIVSYIFVIAFSKFEKLGSRLYMLILSFIPLALLIVGPIINGNFQPNLDYVAKVFSGIGFYFLLVLMLLLSQKRFKKPKPNYVWFPEFDIV